MDANLMRQVQMMMLLEHYDGTGRIMSKENFLYLNFVAVVGEEQDCMEPNI
jgi:hypothetical protein